MLHPDKAIEIMRSFGPVDGVEEVPLSSAMGRALARPLRYAIDQPPFDKSAMDGFAYASARGPGPYRIIGTIPAGGSASREPGPDECYRIMTGAPLPPGCDAVQRVEYTSIQGEFVSFDPIDRDANVIKRAENAKLGDLLLTPRLIAPKDIAILASSGYGRIPVRRALRVAVLSTGDEIMQAGTPLRPGTIYDSNGPALVSQAAQAGCQTEYLGIAPDEEGAITAIALTALQKADVLLLSGGVSMGEFDFVPTALANAGIESVFHTLAMKPGKPTFFGVRREAGATRFVFGLPGNPVSTFVNFAFLVRPLLYALYGIPEPIASVRGAMGKQVKRKSADRVEFLPARFDGSAIWPIEYGGSSMLSALASADGFIRLEIGETDVGEGSVRDLRLV